MTAWLDELRSAPEEELGASYERLVLHALGIGEPPWARWAAAYVQLSEGLTSDRARFLARGSSAAASSDDMRVVAALVHGQRTARLARRAFDGYPPRAGGLVDMGAGSGAAALMATTYGVEDVVLVDSSADALALAARILGAAGARARLLPGDLRSTREGAANAVFAFSLNELRDDEASSVVQRSAATGSAVYVFEPGTAAAARRVQELRDQLLGQGHRVVGPCTHVRRPCPLLGLSGQWCHAAMPSYLGPVARRVLRDAGRDDHTLSASWLVVHPSTERPQGWRVVGKPTGGKGRAAAVLCGEAGVRTVTGLLRSGAGVRVAGLERGAVVELQPSALEERGDGWRVVGEDGLRATRPF